MKNFYAKITVLFIAVIILSGVCYKLAKDTSANMSDSATAYNISSWLAKNNISINKDMIDTSTQKVVSAKLINTAKNHDEISKKMLGDDMTSSGANTYNGKNGTVTFTNDNFYIVPQENVFEKYIVKADKYSFGKSSEEIMKSMGFDLNGSMISVREDGKKLIADITKTIDSKPVFNDMITVFITNKASLEATGIWYIQDGGVTEKRNAKSAADALTELLKYTQGYDKITVRSMTLGYKAENFKNDTAQIKPYWRIELESGDTIYIEA